MKFEIPVVYECLDTIEVEADSLQEAILFVKEGTKVEKIMEEKEACYINKSVRIDDGQNGNASVEETVKLLYE